MKNTIFFFIKIQCTWLILDLVDFGTKKFAIFIFGIDSK